MIKVSARIIKVKKYFCLSISTNYVMDFCDPKEILFYLVLGFSISETWKLLWKRRTFSIIKTKILILISSKGSYCNTHVGHCFQCLPIQNRDGQLQFSSFFFFFLLSNSESEERLYSRSPFRSFCHFFENNGLNWEKISKDFVQKKMK